MNIIENRWVELEIRGIELGCLPGRDGWMVEESGGCWLSRERDGDKCGHRVRVDFPSFLVDFLCSFPDSCQVYIILYSTREGIERKELE